MKKQTRIAGTSVGISTMLSVSPIAEDHHCLQSIVAGQPWTLFKAESVSPALAFLQEYETSVVVCERDLMSGTWVDMLENLRHLTHPPSLIVTSRFADERLWAEALNIGAYDVLAKPFERNEVLRSVKLASLHWHHEIQMPAMSVHLMKAAS